MKIAVFSDVHDNLVRWREAAEIIKREKIKIGFCCGDIGDLQTVEEVANSFETLYLALGNLDFKLKNGLDSRLRSSSLSDEAQASESNDGNDKESGDDRNGQNDEQRSKNTTGLFPENVVFTQDYGEVEL